MSNPDSTRIAAVMLSEREVRALQLIVDAVEAMDGATNGTAGILQRTALPHAQAAVEKLAAKFLPRN